MSAALQLPRFWETGNSQIWGEGNRAGEESGSEARQRSSPKSDSGSLVRAGTIQASRVRAAQPDASLAFYRKHTEKTLRRYLYASMQVGRAPAILGDPIARGWVSSRPVKTFEDAVIFVLDVETCLNQLGSLDRAMLCRIVIQEYTQVEAASLLGMSIRTVSYKFPQALDRLTEKLIEARLLVLPD